MLCVPALALGRDRGSGRVLISIWFAVAMAVGAIASSRSS
jgi:hypothetical protein